ncbi:hypothetical protein BC827DRAFT_1201268 [Russula dissimulans]|nr:hypothetical protein BC827DRAFT_1201268 [Russula dissimulans]
MRKRTHCPIGTASFAVKDPTHFFRPIGYEHSPFTHCLAEKDRLERMRPHAQF